MRRQGEERAQKVQREEQKAGSVWDLEDSDEEDADPVATFKEHLNKNQPRNIVTGVLQGVAYTGIGVAAGAFHLIATPIQGARQGGAKGFIKGLGVGMVNSTVLASSGFVAGGVQMYRGAKNTMSGVTHPVDHPTTQELSTHVEDSQEQQDTGYYAILNIEKSADAAAVKKAYYVLANKYHPDHNPDNPVAAKKFQEVSKAYQTLIDPQKRKQYDMHGEEGLGDSFVDAGTLFNVFFGSDSFEHLTGKLHASTIAERMMASDEEASVAKLRDLLVKDSSRIDMIASNLKSRLHVFLSDPETFLLEAKAEARKLKNTSPPYGERMLHTIGDAYITAGEKFISYAESPFGIRQAFNVFSDTRAKVENIRSTLAAMNNVLGVLQEASQSADRLNEESVQEKVMDSIFEVNRVDVEDVITSASYKACLDRQIIRQDRVKRCQGLIELGHIFREV